MEHEILSVKLNELSNQFDQLREQLMLYQDESDLHKTHHAFEMISNSFNQNEQRLRKNAETSHSPAVASLSACQLAYCEACEKILNENKDSEMIALFAEFAIDYAELAMQYALLAGLAAIDMQMSAENQRGKNI